MFTDSVPYTFVFLAYLPYGEDWVDIRHHGYFGSAYKFNGKEKDPETGYNYYGARYYTDRLSIWLSVDPMSDQRSWVSPYSYCQNNPIMRIDPDGRLDGDYFDREGNHLGNDGIDDGKVYVLNEGLRAKTENTNVNWGGTLADKHVNEIKGKSSEISMDSDLGQMLRTVYAEAAGQGAESKLAVAEVIRNRADDNTKPSASNRYTAQFSNVSTYGEVVNQKGQFESVQKGVSRYSDPLSVTKGNVLEQKAFVGSASAAIKAHFQNTNIADGALFFFSPYIKAPSWSTVLKEVDVSGVSKRDFKFYKYK